LYSGQIANNFRLFAVNHLLLNRPIFHFSLKQTNRALLSSLPNANKFELFKASITDWLALSPSIYQFHEMKQTRKQDTGRVHKSERKKAKSSSI